MPFIEMLPVGHGCRTPGKSVDYNSTWYCDRDECFRIWRFVECERTGRPDDPCKRHWWEGHWELTGSRYDGKIVTGPMRG